MISTETAVGVPNFNSCGTSGNDGGCGDGNGGDVGDVGDNGGAGEHSKAPKKAEEDVLLLPQ